MLKKPYSMDYEVDRIVDFLNHRNEIAKTRGFVLGVSGGVDSALVLALITRTRYPCEFIYMPLEASSPTLPEDITQLSQKFDAEIYCQPILPMVIQAWQYVEPGASKIVKGNIASRCRMVMLYAAANRGNALVVGTTNHTEYMLGYFTKHGDGAVDLEPILHMSKAQVREMAAHLGVPESIIKKAPSADLWDGQTDEGELGYTYDELDKFCDPEFSDKAIPKDILHRMKATNHKRRTNIPFLID